MHWITVDSGPLARMEILRGLLEDEGIPCLIPDAGTKLVDPFITGGDALSCRLDVPEEHVGRARQVIEEVRREAAQQLAADGEPETPGEARDRSLEAMGRRIVWGAAWIVTQPLALFWAYYYLRNTWGKRKPAGHVTVMAALGFVLLTWVAGAAFWGYVASPVDAAQERLPGASVLAPDGAWTVEVPGEWSARVTDGVLALTRAGGVGTLRLRSEVLESPVADSDLREAAREDLDRGVRDRPVEAGDFRGIELFYATEDGVSRRRWYLRSGSLLLLAAYECEFGAAVSEDSEVDEILASLRAAGEGD